MTTADRWRFIVGGIAVLGLLLMGFAFGLGKVTESESFGLVPVLSFLGLFVGRFGEWMYHRSDRTPTPGATE